MSTIKSSAENLTLNADGSGNDIIFQSNGSTQLTLQGSDGSIGMGITTPVGDNARTLHLSDNTGIGFGNGANGRPDFQIQTSDGVRLGFICGEGSSTEDIVMLTSGVLCTPQGIELGSGIDGTAANILDDYEEGTWSPTIVGGLGSLSIASITNSYTKIGDTVFCRGSVTFTGSGEGSGDVQIGGLPFTSSSTFSYRPGITIFAEGMYASVPNGVTGYVQGNNTYFAVREQATTGSGNDVGNHVDAGTGFMINLVYKV